MPPKWEEKISDPNERKVFEALSDPAWDFRTAAGISQATGLSESEVRAILQRYPELVRKSAVPDTKGRELFTLRSHPITAREIIAFIRMVLAKSVR